MEHPLVRPTPAGVTNPHIWQHGAVSHGDVKPFDNQNYQVKLRLNLKSLLSCTDIKFICQYNLWFIVA